MYPAQGRPAPTVWMTRREWLVNAVRYEFKRHTGQYHFAPEVRHLNYRQYLRTYLPNQRVRGLW